MLGASHRCGNPHHMSAFFLFWENLKTAPNNKAAVIVNNKTPVFLRLWNKLSKFVLNWTIEIHGLYQLEQPVFLLPAVCFQDVLLLDVKVKVVLIVALWAQTHFDKAFIEGRHFFFLSRIVRCAQLGSHYFMNISITGSQLDINILFPHFHFGLSFFYWCNVLSSGLTWFAKKTWLYKNCPLWQLQDTFKRQMPISPTKQHPVLHFASQCSFFAFVSLHHSN